MERLNFSKASSLQPKNMFDTKILTRCYQSILIINYNHLKAYSNCRGSTVTSCVRVKAVHVLLGAGASNSDVHRDPEEQANGKKWV